MGARTASRGDCGPERTLAQDRDKAAHIAAVLRTVAHPLRIRIVAILCKGEQHVNGLAELLDAPQAIVSQQLRILRLHELVAVTRADGFAYYRLLEPQLRSLVSCMERCEV